MTTDADADGAADGAAALRRDLVRRGYDVISCAYRGDDGRSSATTAETTAPYASWLEELESYIPEHASVLDLGCGAGVPAGPWLVEAGHRLTGVDISQVQIDRAHQLVPDARFVCIDMVDFVAEDESFDAIITFYALIHVPLQDQRTLFPRLHRWLRPNGMLLAVVGAQWQTATADYLGAPMFWDHADTSTYLQWLERDGFGVLWHRIIPEGDAAHTLVLARRRELPV